MPRMWLSPSPRTLLQSPCRMSIRSLNGSSGVMISLSLKSVPVSSGQKAFGIVPFGLNMMINRWRGRAGAARPRLGQAHEKRQRGRGEAQAFDELPAMNCVHDFFRGWSAGSTPCRAERVAISARSFGRLNCDATNDWRKWSITSEP